MKTGIKRLYLCLLTVFTLVYLVWRIGWTLPLDHRPVDIVFSLILLFTELIGVWEMSVHYMLEGRKKPSPPLPELNKDKLPDVDVLIPTCGEPVELVKQTLSGCLNMEYDGGVHIYLCDDADRSEMKKLAKELDVGYISRKERIYAKAGNLNNALDLTNSPLIAVFDADMCPEPQFLTNTVPYFMEKSGKHKRQKLSEKIGFVQTPQNFRNEDLFQRAYRAGNIIPNEQDYFYLELEPARNSCNAVIFGGSNTLLSRKALNDAGGFITDTLTEDFATGIEIQKHGYRCIAVDTPLAYGLSPENLTDMIRQRNRWARGCIQAGRKTHLLFTPNLTVSQRMSYLAAISYWYAPLKRLIYLLAPLMYSIFGITVMNCDFIQMLMFWLFMYFLAAAGIRFFSGGIRSAWWSDIYELCLFPFLLPGVFAESIGIRKKQFIVTDKSGRRSWKLWYTLPFLVLTVMSALGIVNTVNRIIDEKTTIYLFLLFWLIINLYELLYAFLFVLSCRKLPPQTEQKFRLRRLSEKTGLRMSLLYIFIRIFSKQSKKEDTI
ncbi:MAG: glycosyltransferase [Clostridia bacterium]|nr:glycosyltransferase [Clostridia bacterium]